MPSRKTPFVNGEYYHVFNRGVAKMPIFLNVGGYKRFLKTFLYYQIEGPKPKFSRFDPKTTQINEIKQIVEIISYCLMPNHFHFLLRQIKENGITEFVSKLSNSYTKYFNTKNKRVGPLLQGEFKSVYIETNEQLLHLSRYIHLNPLIGNLVKKLEDYTWSSYLEYAENQGNICSKDIILEQFKNSKEYKQFVKDQEAYGRELDMIKHQLLDGEDE